MKLGDRAGRARLRKDAQARRRAASHREHAPQKGNAEDRGGGHGIEKRNHGLEEHEHPHDAHDHQRALQERRPHQALHASLHDVELELGTAFERDEGERQRVDPGEVHHAVMIDELEHVRPCHDAGEKVAGEVRDLDGLDELAHQRPHEQQESDRGNGADAFVDLGDCARRQKEKGEEKGEHTRLDDSVP